MVSDGRTRDKRRKPRREALSCRQVVRKDKLVSRGYSDITQNSLVEFIEECMAVGGENY